MKIKTRKLCGLKNFCSHFHGRFIIFIKKYLLHTYYRRKVNTLPLI
jgi:hypothetical protein